MTLAEKMKKALVTLLEDEPTKKGKMDANDYIRSIFAQLSSDEDPTKKFKELEALIFQLSSKITVLADKVNELDVQITNLTTLHEELLHTIDQDISELEQQEDNLSVSVLNSNEKKYGLN